MGALLGWLLTLLIVVMLHGMTLAIPGNTGYPDMGPSPGGAGGAIITLPTATPQRTLTPAAMRPPLSQC